MENSQDLRASQSEDDSIDQSKSNRLHNMLDEGDDNSIRQSDEDAGPIDESE